MGFKKSEWTEEEYKKELNNFERRTEEFFFSIFKKLDIHATTKTDRKSLPYNNEIVVTRMGTSFVNEAFYLNKISRPVIKELLDKEIYQLRFYVEIEITDGLFGFGKILYKFRYHIKQ